MKPRDIFGIILRSVALWITIWGAWQLTAAIARFPATVSSFLAGNLIETNSVIYFVYGLPAFLGGIIVLRFADFFINFTYRKPND